MRKLNELHHCSDVFTLFYYAIGVLLPNTSIRHRILMIYSVIFTLWKTIWICKKLFIFISNKTNENDLNYHIA